MNQNKKLIVLRNWLLHLLMNGHVTVDNSSLRGTKQSYQESIKNTLSLVAEEDGVEYKN
jgi:hypothetical protein